MDAQLDRPPPIGALNQWKRERGGCRVNQEFLAMRGEPGKSGASVDHKSVRVDAWFMVWARVLAMGFGALIERLLT